MPNHSRQDNVELKESAVAQQYFLDLCGLIGHQAPPAMDPKGEFFTFEAIAQAARELVEKRQAWLHPEGANQEELKKRTLTNLYNAYPSWLEMAHEKLDHAVLDAYGWPHDLTDEEILERLLTENLRRAEEA